MALKQVVNLRDIQVFLPDPDTYHSDIFEIWLPYKRYPTGNFAPNKMIALQRQRMFDTKTHKVIWYWSWYNQPHKPCDIIGEF